MNMGPFAGISSARSVQQPQPFVLRQGQVFHGTVQQLFPEQTAEVSVGGHRLIAKMEVPLKAGDSHYFVVTSTSPEVQLKIAGGPVSQQPTDAKQIAMLVQSLGLPNTKEMNMLLSRMVSNQLPLTKEQLLAAEAWLKALPSEQQNSALLTLEKMTSLKLPFTDQIFRSVMGGLDRSGLLPLIDNLSNVLNDDQQLRIPERDRLVNTLKNVAEPFRNHITSTLLATATSSLAANGDSTVLNALKMSGILPSTATISDWPVKVLATGEKVPMESLGHILKQLLLSEPRNTAQIIQQVNKTIDTLQLPETLKLSEQTNKVAPAVIQELHQNLVKAFSGSDIQLTGSNRMHFLSLFGIADKTVQGQAKLDRIMNTFQNTQNPNMKQLLQQAIQSTENSLDGRIFEAVIKNVLRNLGLGYEHNLSGKSVESTILDQLKPQLISIIQHPSASAQLKDHAEQIVHRLNGVQLLSAESGHQQQIIMQIPLQFLGKKMDATLNWTGRMKEDGKIDSDYVRILFYLQLSSLKETVVDMAVQNRVVTINVYNESEGLSSLAEPLREALKDGLAAADYRLSGISLKTFAEQSAVKKKTPHSPNVKGVDIRI